MAEQAGFGNPTAGAVLNTREAAKRLLEIAPSLAEARVATAYVKHLDGHFREALLDAHQATQMRAGSKKGSGLVHWLYGWLLMNAGHPDAALREYLLAERADPADPTIQFQLGHPYFAQRNFKEALAHYQKSLDTEPRQYWGYYCKGRVYEETGDFSRAIQEFEKADLIAGKKNETQAKLFYDALRKACDLGGAAGYWSNRLEKALNATPQSPQNIAVLLAYLGKTNEAYEWLEACNPGQLRGLWADLCWDHNDDRFKAVAKKAGVSP